MKNCFLILICCLLTNISFAYGKNAFADSIPPAYPGGEAAMLKFLSENIKYPPEDMRRGVSGIVRLSFVINSEGKVKRVRAHAGPSRKIMQEAIRVIKIMPDWTPGTLDGKKVSVLFNLPIRFNVPS